MIVAAIEGYAARHGVSGSEAFRLFQRHDLFRMIREAWDVLHTQEIDESLWFAEDILAREVG